MYTFTDDKYGGHDMLTTYTDTNKRVYPSFIVSVCGVTGTNYDYVVEERWFPCLSSAQACFDALSADLVSIYAEQVDEYSEVYYDEDDPDDYTTVCPPAGLLLKLSYMESADKDEEVLCELRYTPAI